MRKLAATTFAMVLLFVVGLLLAPIKALESSVEHKQQPEVSIERLTGEAAWRHLDIRIAQNSALKVAYERSRAEMSSRGYSATWTVFVERRIVRTPMRRPPNSVVAQFKHLIMPSLSAQEYSEANGSGEFIATAWDDGNDDTWEGSIYVQRYSDGAWRLYDSQVDAGTSDDSSNAPNYHDFLDGRGGNGPGGPLPIRGPGLRRPKALFANLVGANENLDALRKANAVVTAQSGCDWLCRAGRWASCTRGWCAAAAISAYGCRRTGAAWLPCFGIACTGAQVACAIEEWF